MDPVTLAAAQSRIPANSPIRVVAIGDSLISRDVDEANNSYTDESFITYAQIKSGGRFRIVKNLGVSGENSTEIAGRVDQVAGYSPHACFILAGSNDPSDTVTPATTKANLESMIRVLRAQGIQPILFTLPANDTTTYHSDHSTVNFHIYNLADEYGLALVDLYAATVDEDDGTWASGYSGDGTHPNEVGARVMGQATVDALDGWLSGRSTYLPQVNDEPINLLSNGLMITDAGADGVPDSWTASGPGTATESLEADATFNGQWAVITKTGSADYRQIYQTISSGFSVGDKVAFCGRVDFTAESGSLSCFARITFLTAGTNASPISSWQSDIDGVFYMEVAVPASTTGIQVILGAGSGTGTVKFAQVGVVNLTDNGLD